jgi:hypothetical protein
MGMINDEELNRGICITRGVPMTTFVLELGHLVQYISSVIGTLLRLKIKSGVL